MNVAPITFANRIVKVFGTQRRDQFVLVANPTFAQNPAGSNATAKITIAVMRFGPQTIRHKPHTSATNVVNARPKNRRVSGK